MKKQVHVFYSGRVQGVGFRFTAREAAAAAGVTGWVMNLRDGRVKVVAEAEEKDLQEVLSRLSNYFSSYIRNTDVEWKEATGEFQDFTIRY